MLPGVGRNTQNDAQSRAQQQAQISTEARGSEAALRQEATMEGLGVTPGAARGKEAPQEVKDRGKPQEARGEVSATQAADFARSLASIASGADAPNAAQSVHSEKQEAAPDRESEEEVDLKTLKKESKRRQGPKEIGGSPEIEDPDPPPAAPEPAEPPYERVRPEARAALVDLVGILAAGEDAGILAGYLLRAIEPALRRLNHRDFDRLRRALADAPGRLHQATLLKALAAHRHLGDVEAFVGRIAPLDDEELAARQLAAGEPPSPSHEGTADALRLHFDPIACLDGCRAVRPGPAQALPRWLRGVLRGPLDLAIVAVHQALTGDLDPEERTDQGASAALTRAWRPHAAKHPSLERLLLRLGAESESADDLRGALGTLLATRDSMSR